MKRVQQDHGSSTSMNNPSRASFPSVTANPAAPRSRRASDYPPLSHQAQIMKAVRRSAALPSLSLSIPPSPTQAMTMRSEGSVEEFSLAKEERAKTVTFSEPEDEELSDNSSICQSPSWEQYGQKKKKKPKKGATQKNTKKAEDTALKRKSNRLIKSAPTDLFTTRPLTSSDRSISAPDLGLSTQSNKMDSHPLMAEAQVALGKHRTPRNDLGSTAHGKPKSKGFLSGFRLPHGNVAAVQKPVEGRKGTENSASENEPLRSIQYETLPAQQPKATRLAVDQNTPKPKKAPSIRSVISTSDHSLSSQEKRNSGARTSSSSGHGRSQSLLSSTLNKLRGPSYLYYQPSGDDSTGDASKHPDNPQDSSDVHGHLAGEPNGWNGDSLGERNLSRPGHPQQPFDFSFPPKPRRVNTEPGPDIAPRGRQPRSRKAEIQSPNLEQGITILRPPGGQRVQIEAAKVSTQDTVMALVTAQERRSQAARISQQTRANIANGKQMQDLMKSHQSARTEVDGKRTALRNQKGDVYRSRNEFSTAIKMSSAERLNEGEEMATAEPNRNVRLETGNGHVPEDDRVSIGTYASTIRPISQGHEDGLGESRRQQKPSHADASEPHAWGTAPVGIRVGTEAVVEDSVDDLITFERDVPDTLQQPLQPYREADYFASFSDSYLPPLVDMRPHNNGKNITLGRSSSPDSLDEDSGQGALHGDLQNTHTRRVAVANEGEQKSSHAISSLPKETSRSSDEQKPKNSPAISTQYSDSDVPAFERLGLSSKAAKILSGAETASTSTSHSHQTDPSRTTSERSSSSTCDDSPPSPSSATTPDSSRPQSRKGATVSHLESSQTTSLKSTSRTESGALRKNFRDPLSDRSEERTLRRVEIDLGLDGGSWSEAATTLNVEQQVTPTLARVGGLTSSPSLVATPTSVSFANLPTPDLEEESEQSARSMRPLPPRAQSALDLHSTAKLRPNSSKIQRLQLKPNEEISSVSLPSSPPPDLTEEVMPRKSALKMSRNNSTNGPESSAAISMGAAYLQEARKTAPVATTSSSRALRPHFLQKNSSGSIRSVVSTGNRAEPLAKMLVECCNCHFFHDMPSRVYECMAKPDSVVEDKSLGVSAAITTMVRCPWCAHGMTTQCCSGYAAVVYLKEKLHGK
ncbi:hypothetical protein O1611_g1112 [Lasiodiplodia mahajangana]|uniref:Uncharacterized protein n=1 Tax=Lasiodiplodia mahajangana TaxID=1108764 RepID=A0ACC2JYC2_9PEZI|nr:hypothetical protein O1611_g1112 [Lasiodiplodia mahajangana]